MGFMAKHVFFISGKINEIIFKKVAKYITKHYKNSYIHFIKGKGHCEDVIFDSKKKVKELKLKLEMYVLMDMKTIMVHVMKE